MKTEYYIDKTRSLTPSQDYEYLREAGQQYIESLAHKLWTDYNAHDPGITILEALCYVITELGYRTNFAIEDLLTNEDGKIDNDSFFTAREILTNAPLTVLDYRKVLMDIEGINNAWLIYSNGKTDDLGYEQPLENEIPIYINPKEDKLSFSNLDKYGNSLNRLALRGLNKIVVELSEDMTLGELNEVALDHSWFDGDRFVEVHITLEFDSWNDPKADLLRLMNKPTKIKFKQIEELEDTIKITVERQIKPTDTLTLYFTPRDPDELQQVKDYFDVEKTICYAINLMAEKKKKVDAIFAEVNNVLYENRNLTEDWLCVETICEVEVGVCADIELNNEVDAEEILAQVQQTIDEILTPPIPFYTLNQMLDMDKDPREIFSGPSLQHGFLLDEEVQNAQLADCIHASDIIAAIMDLPGVKAVNNLLMTAYDKDGTPIESAMNQPWCLNLDGQKKPVFAFDKSKLLLFRDGIPFLIPEKGGLELSQGVYYLKTQNNTLKLQNPENDFAIPEGRFYQLDEYHSVQNDFPVTYGIGMGQLLDTTPALRKAQAKQLKAYLQHFDQLLGDYFSQLYHAKELFDLKTIQKTYFPKYIDNIPGIDEELFADEAYAALFQTTLINGEEDDDRSLYENDPTFYDRRNRFLDHLMARFGESFNDYVFMSYAMQENANGIAELTFQDQELIEDKQRFLSQYPKLSYARGLGFNYCQALSADPEHPWQFAKRGGYEKRVAALLGINSIVLQDIVDDDPKNNWSYETDIGTLEFQLLNTVPLSQAERWELAHQLMHTISAYRIDTFSKSYIYFVNKDHKKIAKFKQEFDTEREAKEFIPKLYQALNSHLENFYCLEHILLRPMVEDDLTDEDLLTVCLNDDCFSEDHNDPYSFKATMVMPGWLARFRNRYFRDYAERIIRQEAPAHTMIKVCWVGRDDMIAFQDVYRKWILAYQKFKAKFCGGNLSTTAKKQYNKALSDLIEQVKELNTIYDEGTLYDCQESELDNPIILNNSSLGTLQNIEP
ncbi:hypothetical protein POV27_14940 [Aureisphaera galaxeae]|uniref:hypothetical protein n=1 Tax=Aureisphaera galaxeae TaxID=1538023 RepID=UPI00234FF5C8|nr:hypothetical protein [Aureisphaera galaxeae]MDC8005357.1 hypothetical protein [Aureisphaera galaxeae]